MDLISHLRSQILSLGHYKNISEMLWNHFQKVFYLCEFVWFYATKSCLLGVGVMKFTISWFILHTKEQDRVSI